MSETLPTHNGIPNIEIEPAIREWVINELEWACLFVGNIESYEVIQERIKLIKDKE